MLSTLNCATVISSNSESSARPASTREDKKPSNVLTLHYIGEHLPAFFHFAHSLDRMTSQTRFELNCDMGESLGQWKLADDEGIMPNIDVANMAAGYHASDPCTMHYIVRLAKQNKVRVGAHPGFPDLVGFGRRRMELTAQEVHDLILYQTGAVNAFCSAEGITLNHVKPHGAMYFYLLTDKEIARAAMRAIKVFNVPVYGLPNTLHEEAAKEEGVEFVAEFFADTDYTSEGQLIPPAKSKKATPEDCANRVREVLHSSSVQAKACQGRSVISVCLHSDMKGATENSIAVRQVIDSLNSSNKS